MTDGGWFESAWEYREEVVYRGLFGTPEGDGIYVLKPIFFSRFGDQELDPRWLHHGAFVFPPSAQRQSWLYVTSGLSNAWEASDPDPEGTSGLGCEFLFETPERFLWALGQTLEILAFQLLLAAGRFPDRSLLAPYDRIPLHDSLEPGGDSKLTTLLVCPCGTEYPAQRLVSGVFEFFRLVGVSANEASFARVNGGEQLVSRLRDAGHYPVTDPNRLEIL